VPLPLTVEEDSSHVFYHEVGGRWVPLMSRREGNVWFKDSEQVQESSTLHGC